MATKKAAKKATPKPRGRKGGRKSKYGTNLEQRSVRLHPAVWDVIDDQPESVGDYITRKIMPPAFLAALMADAQRANAADQATASTTALKPKQ